jgi:hypothetical protein
MPTDVEVDAALAVLGGDRNAVKRALSAAEHAAFMEKRKHCKHLNSFGSGSICSDGSGHYRWWCRDCGESFETVNPPRPVCVPTALLWN